MPLREHFQGPQTWASRWEAMHSSWPTYIAESLSEGLLPPHYYAVPQVTVGSVEVDVGTFGAQTQGGSQNGGVATAVYASPAAAVTAVVDWSELDASEVLVHDDGGRLVAAIELVSPRNKDRPASRQALAIKCASYLLQSCSLVLIDVVTSRAGNLHAELLRLVAPQLAGSALTDASRYAVSYHTLRLPQDQTRFDLWPFALAVGELLPVVPLWLTPELVLPLDLEKSYLDACRMLRLS